MRYIKCSECGISPAVNEVYRLLSMRSIDCYVSLSAQVMELGSGLGVPGLLAARTSPKVFLTDHNPAVSLANRLGCRIWGRVEG